MDFENHFLNYEQRLCITCFAAITHPICLNCHLNHIDYWLKDLNLGKNKKTEITEKVKKNLLKESPNEDVCVICNEETISVCTYCFFLKVILILKKSGVDLENTKKFIRVLRYTTEDNYSLENQIQNS